MTTTAPRDDWCTCFHPSRDHVRRVGRCKAAISYGTPCQCPSFELDPNEDEPGPEHREH